MQIKDYYKILEVTPVATPQEIKKSFRRLALKYHPDKNNGDHLSESLFKEVQEAYEVLSDPKQREEYNYKRWYNRSIGETFTNRPITPAAILAESNKLKEYVQSMNIFQVDYDSLSFHIRQLLTDNSIGILQQHNDPTINREIVQALLRAAAPLPMKYATPVSLLLARVAMNDQSTLLTIQRFAKDKQQQELWNKYKWIVVLLVTALICWLMMAVAG